MFVLRRRLVAGVMTACALGLGGCGAGLIGGIASSSSGSSGSEARAPQLSITSSVLPLVPATGDVRTVILAGLQLVGAEVEVQIFRPVEGGEPDPADIALQKNAIVRVQGTSTIVSFELDLSVIAAGVANPSAVDLDALLRVMADDQEIAPPISVVLVRQPSARLVLDESVTEAIIPPAGGCVEIEVEGLLSTDPAAVQVLVTTRDPESSIPGATVTRLVTDVEFLTVPSGIPTLEVTIPGNQFPDAVTFQVLDAIAGQSEPITNAYYRPDIALALPGQGPTTGGSLLTLIGSALVPYDSGTAPAQFDFDRISLTFEKDGRVTELPREDFRIADSGSDRLVFTMPPSPDGRPGLVDIILKIRLDEFDAEVTAKLFLFANADPYYGPRGAVLDQPSVAAMPVHLDNAPSVADAPDFAILTEQGGVGYLQLLLAQQNGMFQPFAAPRKIGNHEIAAEHSPRDLLVGDFDGDGIPDLFVVNEGGNSDAVHHVVLGQGRPAPPLGAVFRFPAAGGSRIGRVGFFDGDSLLDIVLVPGPGAAPGARPEVWLSRPMGIGTPNFVNAGFPAIGNFAYEAIEIADLDRDGNLDIALASGSQGVSATLAVAFGDGTGAFLAPPQPLNVDVLGYTASSETRAVGLHACEDGGPASADLQSLAIVLSGDGSTLAPATVAVLQQVQPRSYNPSVSGGAIYQAPEGIVPFGLSMAANLDQDPAGLLEMVVTIGGEPTVVSSGLLQFDGIGFQALAGAIENGTAGGTEVPVLMSSLSFATAFPAGQVGPEAKAVFIVHEVDVDGARERRLSTRLVTIAAENEPRLLPPDAGASVSIVIDNIAGGNFSNLSVLAEGRALDLALASRNGLSGGDEITVIVNDGFGGFPGFGKSVSYPGLVPNSMAVVPAEGGELDSLVFASAESRIGLWQNKPGKDLQHVDVETQPLRDLVPHLAGRQLGDATQIQVADVDGDSKLDLVVLLTFEPAEDQGNSWLALLRGKQVYAVGEFPFHTPTHLLNLGRSASSFVLGDFAPHEGSALEVALAVPVSPSGSVNSNHVVFCHYVAGSNPVDDRFVLSAASGGPQVLLAGSDPRQVAANDFDGDGLVDLLVACKGDRSLRLFRNTSAPGGDPYPVDVGAFVEAFGSPKELAAGTPTVLRLGDVNGDGNLDAVVATEFSGGSGVSTSVATYLSSGTGELSDARFASATRLGLFGQRLSLDIGDWNRDDVPDLFLGWGVQGPSLVNLRVLFGGTR